MKQKRLKKILDVLVSISSISMQKAESAEISNNDTTQKKIVATEGAFRHALVLAPGDIITFCQRSCYILLDNGDRAALRGQERVIIMKEGLIIN